MSDDSRRRKKAERRRHRLEKKIKQSDPGIRMRTTTAGDGPDADVEFDVSKIDADSASEIMFGKKCRACMNPVREAREDEITAAEVPFKTYHAAVCDACDELSFMDRPGGDGPTLRMVHNRKLKTLSTIAFRWK